jgi:hypothetical protein
LNFVVGVEQHLSATAKRRPFFYKKNKKKVKKVGASIDATRT